MKMSENNCNNVCQPIEKNLGILDMITSGESQDNRCKFTCLDSKDLNNVPDSFKGFGVIKDNGFNLVKPRCVNVSNELKQLMSMSEETIRMMNSKRDNQTKELISKLLKYLQDLYEFGTLSIDTCMYCKYSEHTCNNKSCEYCNLKLKYNENPDYKNFSLIPFHTKEYHKIIFGKIFGYSYDHKPQVITDHYALQILVNDYLVNHGTGSNMYPILKYFQKINGYSEYWVNKICWGSKNIDMQMFTSMQILENQCQQNFYKNTLLEFIDKVKQYSELIVNNDRLRTVLQILCIDNIGLIKSCLQELRINDYNIVSDECIDKYLENYMTIISNF